MHWIIGDIHGMLKPLEGLLEEIDRLDPAASLCFTGDFINRGPESRQVVDLLLTLGNARFIRGNHDDIFDQILTGRCFCENATAGDRMLAVRWFMDHGLADTFLSYGIAEEDIVWTMRRMKLALLEELLQSVPQSHRDFFRDLPPLIETPAFFVAHGKWDPQHDLAATPMTVQLTQSLKARQDLLWGRWESSEIDAPKSWPRPGYFGHTPVENYPIFLENGRLHPIRGDRMVLLDTSVALRPQGLLSAWCHELNGYIQTDRAGGLAHNAIPR